MSQLSLVIVHGTKRAGNWSRFVARHVERVAGSSGEWVVNFVDPNELSLPGDGDNYDTRDPRYSQLTAEADAFFLVTPEYNHSFPATLKRILDSEDDNYVHKPVAVAGVSSGRFSGVRAVAALAEVTRTLGLVMTRSDVLVAQVEEAYNPETGEANHDYIETSIQKALTELKWMAEALKAKRETGS
jgi:NAD(P)H-dependent FMN reductase